MKPYIDEEEGIKQMNKQTEVMLMHDSLSETEKLLGQKHWSEFNEIENIFAITKQCVDGQTKHDYFKGLGDTYFSMKWDEFKNLIMSYGFIKALEYDFNYLTSYNNTKEEAIIYYHPDKGLVIWATSYGGKDHINGGNLYGEIQAKSKDDCKTIWKWISTGGCIDESEMVYKTSHDIREGLFSKLNELETVGTFLNRWIKKDRFLWFVDYMEDQVKNYEYEVLTQNKINKCSQEFREIIGR